MTDIFKNRYILGEGYPWMMGINTNTQFSMSEIPVGFKPVLLNFPIELWHPDLPKYRLVLEKIEDNK